MSFVAELKRRNVFKVGAAYLVVGWVMIEVASTVAPHLSLPEWTPRLVTFLILLGFPVALALAWIFDMTPEGVRVTTGDAGSKRFYGIVALIAAVSIGGFFFYGSGVMVPGQSGDLEGVDGRSSIAVLPFVNMSTEAENEFFADGISEELLNILAGIEGLDVASRTSAFSFKGKDTPVPEIARLLGVRHVLEGSVRRQGKRVRITAQLIDAERDVHMWSETYDRDLTDIFVVQEEIAQAITDALHDILGTRQVEVHARTGNLEAYERFLAARARFYQRQAMDEVLAEFRAIVEMDPQLVEAWAFLGANAFVSLTSDPETVHSEETLIGWINEGVDRALAADPRHSLALATRGGFAFRQGDVVTAMAALPQAASNERSGSTAHLWAGIHHILVGKPGAAFPYLEEAYRRDPMVSINEGYLAAAHMMNGREVEALKVGRQVLASGAGNAAGMLGLEYAMAGNAQLAVEFFSYMLRGTGNMTVTEQAGMVADFAGAMEDPSRRASLLGRDVSRELTPFFQVAFEDPRFFDFLASDDGTYIMTMIAWMPSGGWIREHPRFFAYMDSIGVTEYWAQQGYPDGCALADGSNGRHLRCGGGD